MTGSPWPTIHAERSALIDDLAQVTPAQWATPSLCADWNARQVLGHITATAKMTPPRFFARMIAAGFRFDAMSAKEVARETSGTTDEQLAELRAHVNDSTSPPGPADTWLGEIVLHAEDIRRPLGIAHQYPVDAVVRVADFYKGSNLIVGAKKRIAGLTLRATDADWTHGSGPEVTGPILSLALAMTGRAAVLGDLSGAGLDTLRRRF